MKARGETTRRAVLRAAEEVFAERGFAGARMDDVAERAGIRRASMVYYFRDKQALYEALLDDIFTELLTRYEGILVGPGPVGDRILGCLDTWVAQVAARPGLLRITMWELARASESGAVSLPSRVGPIVRALADAVATGQREGVFRDVDPVRFVMTITGTTVFLTLGLRLVEVDGAPRRDSTGVLGLELRSLVRRILFVD